MLPKPIIAVAIPFRERLEAGFVMDTLVPLYDAQGMSNIVNTLKARYWDNDEMLTMLEQWNPLKKFRLLIRKYLMDDMPHVSASRNRLAEAARGRGADYIYWLDSDMRVLGGSLDALNLLYEASVEHDADMVSGMYLSKKDRKLCAYMWDGEAVQVSVPRDEVPKWGRWVDGVGFGCLLMNVSILEKVSQPWFFCDSVYDYSEDTGFCRRAGDVGAKIWLHEGVKFAHIGLQELTIADER